MTEFQEGQIFGTVIGLFLGLNVAIQIALHLIRRKNDTDQRTA